MSLYIQIRIHVAQFPVSEYHTSETSFEYTFLEAGRSVHASVSSRHFTSVSDFSARFSPKLPFSASTMKATAAGIPGGNRYWLVMTRNRANGIRLKEVKE